MCYFLDEYTTLIISHLLFISEWLLKLTLESQSLTLVLENRTSSYFGLHQTTQCMFSQYVL